MGRGHSGDHTLRRIYWTFQPALRGPVYALRGDWLASRCRVLEPRLRHGRGAGGAGIRVRVVAAEGSCLLHRAGKCPLPARDGETGHDVLGKRRFRSPTAAGRTSAAAARSIPVATTSAHTGGLKEHEPQGGWGTLILEIQTPCGLCF